MYTLYMWVSYKAFEHNELWNKEIAIILPYIWSSKNQSTKNFKTETNMKKYEKICHKEEEEIIKTRWMKATPIS